jgi:hypothetical protein
MAGDVDMELENLIRTIGSSSTLNCRPKSRPLEQDHHPGTIKSFYISKSQMDQVMDAFVGTWTNVTSDRRLVQHLLDLYFCWEYPTLASLSREHFMEDFSAGRPRFCSPLLVNALLALASRFSDRPELRTDSDPHTTGDAFFAEAQRLFWGMNGHHSLPTIQAVGIMAIRQASCGRDRESRYYAGQSVRLCIETGLHRLNASGPQNDERTVQLATFWGAFALDQYMHHPSYLPPPLGLPCEAGLAAV